MLQVQPLKEQKQKKKKVRSGRKWHCWARTDQGDWLTPERWRVTHWGIRKSEALFNTNTNPHAKEPAPKRGAVCKNRIWGFHRLFHQGNSCQCSNGSASPHWWGSVIVMRERSPQAWLWEDAHTGFPTRDKHQKTRRMSKLRSKTSWAKTGADPSKCNPGPIPPNLPRVTRVSLTLSSGISMGREPRWGS